MLKIAVAAGAGVAGARLLGLRDLDERTVRSTAARLLGQPEMALTTETAAMPEAPADASPGGALPPEGLPTVNVPAPDRTAAPRPSARPTGSANPAAAAAGAAPSPPVGSTADPLTGLDWNSPLDAEGARIAQLLRRATFGATAEELDRARSDGYARTVDRLIDTPPAAPPVLMTTDAAGKPVGLKLDQVQSWWLDAMIGSPTPFAERMTLFWHGHFTSDYRKVGLQRPYIYWQNLTWRSYALSDLRTLLYQVTIDPAMLRYLDLGISTGTNPNENYARELMELYTIGVDQFTEDDVRAGARALAGWREPRDADSSKVGIFAADRAYKGALTFLGRTGTFDTQAVIDRILAQDATASFIVKRVLAQFLTRAPSDALVVRLATRFRASKYDLRGLMRDVFTAPEMFAQESYRSLVKSPVEFTVGVAKALATPGISRSIIQASGGMGQVLFDPPSVGGWPRNEAWISSNTMVARANFVATALGQAKTPPPAREAHLMQLDGILGPQTASLLQAATDDRRRWAVVLSAPEFQLK